MEQVDSGPQNVDAGNNPRDSMASARSWPPRMLPLVLGGLTGSLIGWGCMQAIYPIFLIPPEVLDIPSPPPLAAIEKLEAYQYVVGNKNYSIVFGITGLAMGVCCAAFTVGRQRPISILLSGLLGAGLGAVGGILCNTIVTNTRAVGGNDIVYLGITLDGMAQAIIAHVALWGLMGLGVGGGLGLGARGIIAGAKAGLGGLLGGAAAATLFLFASAFLFPNSNSNQVTPNTVTEQIGWIASAGLLIGGSIALGTGERKRKLS